MPASSSSGPIVPSTGEELLRSVRTSERFDLALLPMAVLDLEGRVVITNRALVRLVGEDLTGRLLDEARVGGEGLRTCLQHAAAGLDGGQVRPVLRGADGGPVPILLTWTLMRTDEGRPWYLTAVLVDETERVRAEAALQASERTWRALLAHAADVTWRVDEAGTLLWASSSLPGLLGYDLEAVVGTSLFDLLHEEDLSDGKAAFAAVVRQDVRQVRLDLRVRHADGSYRVLQVTVTDLRSDPDVRGLVGNAVDVTELRRQQREREADQAALRELEQRREEQERFFGALAARASDLALVADADGRLVFVSPAARHVLGYEAEALVESIGYDVVHPDDVDDVRRAVEAVVSDGGTRTFRLRVRAADGTWRWMEETVTNLLATPVGGLVANLRDITDQVRAEEDLRRAALADALTGLPNRTLLLDRLEHALSRESIGTAVVFLDLDHFKLVNDTSGHATGDELLLAVAQRLSAVVRPGDTVARFGGDEFVVVAEDVDSGTATDLAEELLDRVAEPYRLADRDVQVTASAGVAVSPGTAAELLARADTALYAAKDAGRRQVRLYDPRMTEQAEQRAVVGRELRVAVAAGAVDVHYQPVVDLEDGQVLAVEALARWEGPRGPVPPNAFVPVAEETGLIADLDALVLRTALAEVADMRRTGALGAGTRVAVNLSARSLADGRIEQVLAEAAGDSGLTPEDVELEITETAVVDDARKASDVLGRLRSRGYRIAVDDFGTGYSSLAYLRTLPVDVLKVDRSFIAGLETDSDALAIVASIVDLARAVDLDVVAEGVETVGQAAVLRRLGCRAAQGWLWSRALPAERVRLADWPAGFGLGTRRRVRAAPAALTDEHGLSRLLAMHAEGASLSTIAAALNSEGYRTPDGVRWHRVSVARAVATAAYPRLVDGPGALA